MPNGAEILLPLPEITEENRAFWTGGSGGLFLIQHCDSCTRFVHPPVALCPTCGTRDGLVSKEVSGHGRLASITINYQKWFVSDLVPAAYAIVELDEQKALWVMTRLVGHDAIAGEIGDRVRVRFEPSGDVWLPVFELDR